MNPADERIRELLDKWLASLELHLKYVSLDEASYRSVQPWPEHDRPSRWIIEVARGKARELRDHVESRMQVGDATFFESLELMAFLVNLVGAPVDRFIPLAEPTPDNQTAGDSTSTGTQPVIAAAPTAAPAPPIAPAAPLAPVTPATRAAPPPTPTPPPPAPKAAPPPPAPAPPAPESHMVRVVAVAPTRSAAPVIDETTVVRASDSGERRALKGSMEATREMPRPAVRPPLDSDDTVETRRAKLDTRKATRRETKPRSETRTQSERAASSKDTSAKDINAMVTADAVRLIVWGRKWHELVELIGRFAGRPSATEIRRILRENRASIEKTADKERSKTKK